MEEWGGIRCMNNPHITAHKLHIHVAMKCSVGRFAILTAIYTVLHYCTVYMSNRNVNNPSYMYSSNVTPV